MTQSTEKERVSLPLWMLNELLALCKPEDHELRDRVKQAARRAQVGPDGWLESLAELVAAMRRYEMDVDGRAPEQHRAMMRRAELLLAAAPQPPEGQINCANLEQLNKNNDLAPPVQMPEADAYMDAEDAHRVGTSSDWVVTGDKRAPDDVALYTEHQVRQLLAANGVK